MTNEYDRVRRLLEPGAALQQTHDVFQRWLGSEYDLDAIDAVLCTLAAERLDGDPLWLLIVSGPGAAKTETVQACAGAGAHIESTLTGEAALLSGSPARDRARNATGGLLRSIGDRGVLVLKDVTSILSMNRDRRAELLAAFREIYDGRWSRNLGADGGRTITWEGRIAIIGAVTTAWDTAHAVISSMGDRFVVIRMDSNLGRIQAGRRTAANTGSEIAMRAELAATVGHIIDGINPHTPPALTDDENEILLAAADIVTRARASVEYDYRGNVVDAHAPEMPTRFLRQIQQVARGGIALGMDRDNAVRLALRCARDSMPPLRLAILEDIAEHPEAPVREVRRRLNKPRATVDRQLQALHMLGLLDCDEEEESWRGQPATIWRYRIPSEINLDALNPKSVPEMSFLSSSPLKGKEIHGSLLDITGTEETQVDGQVDNLPNWDHWPEGSFGAQANP